uniref:Ferritin domain-containing protein n=1 Tax=Macrostomum lignano TaxID=282301 RepID=A0A1I8F5K3_9PLAT
MAGYSLLSAILLHLVVVSMQQDDDAMRLSRFNSTSVSMINDQIQREFNAMYLYETMAQRRSSRLQEILQESADEEREHAHKLIDYLNMRGGHQVRVVLRALTQPRRLLAPRTSTCTGVATDCEIGLTRRSDPHLWWTSSSPSPDRAASSDGIRDLRELIARLNKAGSGLGELIVDKEPQLETVEERTDAKSHRCS